MSGTTEKKCLLGYIISNNILPFPVWLPSPSVTSRFCREVVIEILFLHLACLGGFYPHHSHSNLFYYYTFPLIFLNNICCLPNPLFILPFPLGSHFLQDKDYPLTQLPGSLSTLASSQTLPPITHPLDSLGLVKI